MTTESNAFSLVLHGAVDRPQTRVGYDELEARGQAALIRAFGNANVYSAIRKSVVLGHPIEIVDNLGEADTIRRAEILRDAGFVVEVVATDQVATLVPEIGWRAEQCWPTHATADGRFLFSRVDGSVVFGPVGDTRHLIWRARFENPNASDTAIELSTNHYHPTHDFHRDALRAARLAGDELASALRECFPGETFFVVYCDADVSFCQATNEIPFSTIVRVSSSDDENGWLYCESCGEARPVTPRAEPDSEFPRATFGDCDVCGGEVLMDCRQEIVRVRP